jgi:hypothetical protein
MVLGTAIAHPPGEAGASFDVGRNVTVGAPFLSRSSTFAHENSWLRGPTSNAVPDGSAKNAGGVSSPTTFDHSSRVQTRVAVYGDRVPTGTADAAGVP